MTRWKKEIRKKGVKLECDYPMIPFDLGPVTVLGVYDCKDWPGVIVEYNVDVVKILIGRNGKLYHEVEV